MRRIGLELQKNETEKTVKPQPAVQKEVKPAKK